MRVGGNITCNNNIIAGIGKFTSQMLIGPKEENVVTVNKDDESHAIALKWKKTGITSTQSGLYVYIDDNAEYGPIITNNK